MILLALPRIGAGGEPTPISSMVTQEGSGSGSWGIAVRIQRLYCPAI